MHIGNARTALFNWLYAKHMGGKMVFRIEDTDRARHSEAAVQAIINGLTWLGLDWDGDIISQFARKDRHAEVAHELLKKGQAYYCYCSPEELEAMREKAKAEGRATFYDRRWRDSKEKPPAGVKPVIRIKAPLEGSSTIQDHVQGEVTVQNEQLDDMIILRSDGTPVYQLAVVVDDHDMGVTHVLRGDDHLNNTFRQNVIIEAMGWKAPEYGHMPMILSDDGSKMSKRKGGATLEEFQAMGYLPEAMCNYLLRLGWSHGDDEIISRQQAIEWFDLDGIVKSPARWDYDKLNHLNAHYIKEADDARLVELLIPFLTPHLNPPPSSEGRTSDTKPSPTLGGEGLDGGAVSAQGQTRLLAMMPELKSRAVTLVQMAEEAAFLVKSAPLDMNEAAQKLLDADGKAMLKQIADRFTALEPFTHDKIEEACRALATDTGAKLGKIMMPLRAALTGRDKSPSLFHAIEILGREETINRIKAVL